MYILGINSAYHETAACLLKDGLIIAMAEEERFTRRKHGKEARIDNPDELPECAIEYCLKKAGISPKDVAAIGLSISPADRLINKDFKEPVVPNNWGSSEGETLFFEKLQSIPGKIRQFGFDCSIEWLHHHACHAASAFYLSPFEDAAILTVDGIGESTSTAFSFGQDQFIHTLMEISYPHSLGFLWEKFSKFLGFTDYDAAKVMGLAAFGNYKRYLPQFEQLLTLTPAGKFEVDSKRFCFRIEDYRALEELFQVKKLARPQDLTKEHEDIAAALQKITDIVMLHMVNELQARTQTENLCLAGGVALNCVSNREIFEEGPFARLYIQPAAHDAGTAIGAACMIWHTIYGQNNRAVMRHPYYGPAFSDSEVEQTLLANCLTYHHIDNIAQRVAEIICEGSIVGWFQGAMELGPRALGNRSLLADARNPCMQEIMNRKVKHREPFRPFAPSVLHEEADKWFEIVKPTLASDFMLLSYMTKKDVRDKIPAVVHVDGSSRIQTVRKETNPSYHALISEVFKLSGVPMVLNTSFNDSEPIVCTPQDAVHTFLKTQIDYLAIGNFLVSRQAQKQRQ